MVVDTTDFWDLNDHPGLNVLDCTRLWAVHVQREVGAPVVVVAEVAAQETPQVLLAEHDDMVEALVPVLPEPPPLPLDDGGRLHEDQCLLRIRLGPGEPSPEDTVGRFEAGLCPCPLVDGQLVPQGQDLKLHWRRLRKGSSSRARKEQVEVVKAESTIQTVEQRTG